MSVLSSVGSRQPVFFALLIMFFARPASSFSSRAAVRVMTFLISPVVSPSS